LTKLLRYYYSYVYYTLRL